MARYAIVKNGVVVNVVLAEEGFALAGAIACPDGVSPRWTYDGQDFAAPAVPPVEPKRSGLDQGEFRLLFTFAERQGEAAYKRAAEAAAHAGTASAAQLVYLTMRDDFDQAGEINLDDVEVGAALDFYIAFGLIEAERKADILSGVRPA